MNNLPDIELILKKVKEGNIDFALYLLNQYSNSTTSDIRATIIVLQSKSNYIKKLSVIGMLSTKEKMVMRCDIALSIVQTTDEIKSLDLSHVKHS